ncbi:MAG: hypothetical protein LQ347_000927 [Umbilicaria vellea]|nr:MAG: hypothetical protein LQ347_000927 [Umbilicaria vellea]
MKYYQGNQTGQTVGILPNPYYWWEAGAMFAEMIEYWFYTGDATYNEVVTQGLLAQVGPDNDYMPPNQTKTEGNDDQVFWAFACMNAAEMQFPNPPSGSPQWLALAQAVFNLQAARWDDTTCNGGLRWQVFAFNKGYDYKNSISNGGFFQLAARLARYTGNQTYADWAEKTWDWWAASQLVTPTWAIYDGAATANNCSNPTLHQWSYNAGTFLMGAAYMYNHTNGSALWGSRVGGILNGTEVFFPDEYGGGTIMVEVACEPIVSCNNDQPSFKAYLSRWLAVTTQLAPFTSSWILPKLLTSAKGAALQCSGGSDGTTCGRKWYQATWDGKYGVGLLTNRPSEQMSALSIVQANLISKVPPPVTANTGGHSQGDPSAGGGGDKAQLGGAYTDRISTGDRAGAGILTALVLVGLLWMLGWMLWDEVFSGSLLWLKGLLHSS